MNYLWYLNQRRKAKREILDSTIYQALSIMISTTNHMVFLRMSNRKSWMASKALWRKKGSPKRRSRWSKRISLRTKMKWKEKGEPIRRKRSREDLRKRSMTVFRREGLLFISRNRRFRRKWWKISMIHWSRRESWTLSYRIKRESRIRSWWGHIIR